MIEELGFERCTQVSEGKECLREIGRERERKREREKNVLGYTRYSSESA